MKLVTEKRELSSAWFRFSAPVVSILVALFVAGFLLLAAGVNPLQAYLEIVREALGSVYGLSETLVKTTPLIFASLGVSLAFRMQIWNIGAEGQIYMGACGAKTCGGLVDQLFRQEGVGPERVTRNVERPLFVEVPLGVFCGAGDADAP